LKNTQTLGQFCEPLYQQTVSKYMKNMSQEETQEMQEMQEEWQAEGPPLDVRLK
jgi:hypothetical protein